MNLVIGRKNYILAETLLLPEKIAIARKLFTVETLLLPENNLLA